MIEGQGRGTGVFAGLHDLTLHAGRLGEDAQRRAHANEDFGPVRRGAGVGGEVGRVESQGVLAARLVQLVDLHAGVVGEDDVLEGRTVPHVGAQEGPPVRRPHEAPDARIIPIPLHEPAAHDLPLEGHARCLVVVVAVDGDLHVVAMPVEGDRIVVARRHVGNGFLPELHLALAFHGINGPGVRVAVGAGYEDTHRSGRGCIRGSRAPARWATIGQGPGWR